MTHFVAKSVLVIGAGAVGLAAAMRCAQSGADVVVIDAEDAIGTQTSARNSGVVHAGLYYPHNSQKAKFCVKGREMLYAHSARFDVAHSVVQKLIVASNADQIAQLHALQTRAADNGVTLDLISGAAAQELEPQLRVSAALVSAKTGIVDAPGLMLSYLTQAEAHGATVILNTKIDSITRKRDQIVVTGTSAGDAFDMGFDRVINAAGHGAYRLAEQYWPQAPKPPKQWAKGSYFAISGPAPFNRLVYPLPEQAGLGIHYTVDLGGQGQLGPNVDWVDQMDPCVDPALDPVFRAAVRQYWPAVDDRGLNPAYAGFRPKIAGDDFVLNYRDGIITFLGIESPGLTASLALGTWAANQIAQP